MSVPSFRTDQGGFETLPGGKLPIKKEIAAVMRGDATIQPSLVQESAFQSPTTEAPSGTLLSSAP